MNIKHLPRHLWFVSVPLALAIGSLAFGFGRSEVPETEPSSVSPPQSDVDTVCASPIFEMGRAISFHELSQFNSAKFRLESVHFRNVVWRTPNDIEFAYQVDMKMRIATDRFLVPEHVLACKVENKISKSAEKLSRTMIPVLGDLHLPSSRITVFDQASSDRDRLYNHPRISEMTVSSKGYFSFNQNWAPYRKLQSLGQYLDHLRYQSFYEQIELREMGYGRIGIFAQKDVTGERAQLLVVLKQ